MMEQVEWERDDPNDPARPTGRIVLGEIVLYRRPGAYPDSSIPPFGALELTPAIAVRRNDRSMTFEGDSRARCMEWWYDRENPTVAELLVWRMGAWVDLREREKAFIAHQRSFDDAKHA